MDDTKDKAGPSRYQRGGPNKVSGACLVQRKNETSWFVFQRESTRLLNWLKALKETHGSVEQSSLSLASSINECGVYSVGWSERNTERVSGQS